MARASPSRALNSDDLPTFGAPASTTSAPSWTIEPSWAVASSVSHVVERRSRGQRDALARDRAVVLLGKVDVVGEQRLDLEDALAKREDPCRQAAVELVQREALSCS